jgi:hypothetical protein
MHITITNNLDTPEAVVGTSGEEFTEVVSAKGSLDVTNDADVVVIGDKVSVREQIQRGLARLTTTARLLVEAIFQRRDNAKVADVPDPGVNVAIANHGANALRVIMSNKTGVAEVQLDPGATTSATADDYVELRELGVLDESQVDGGKQPATA